MHSLFCRHNRFTADCPICSKGTPLETPAPGARRPRRARAKPKDAAPSGFRGPHSSAGPYARDSGEAHVRLERVPGGVRLAEWAAGKIAQRAPVLPGSDLRALVMEAIERELLSERDADALAAALEKRPDPAAPPRPFGASPGTAGDMRDELRVEALGEEGEVRVARWLLRPRADWEMVDAAPMLPGRRYAGALADAAARGLL